MIYLISDNDYLKIGYAKDPKKRLHNIQTGNIKAELLRYKAGSIRDEKNLHELCKQGHVKREGFQNVYEVIKAFDKYNSFSDNELQILKDKVLEFEKTYNTNNSIQLFFNNDFGTNLDEKIKEGPIPENGIFGINSYNNIKDYIFLVSVLKQGSGIQDASRLKTHYQVNKTLIDFPLDLFSNFENKVKEEIKRIRVRNENLQMMSKDQGLVTSKTSYNIIKEYISRENQDLEYTIDSCETKVRTLNIIREGLNSNIKDRKI